ncbi:MAG: hypothetical protein E8D49_02370 [Nitrospira sp.]|nr:MAG: hypothetical protein E8D49_02370 [Nitrospira sp.]
MQHSLLRAGTIASLIIVMAAPAVLPNVVFAQADIRQEDRRVDRQLDRREDRQKIGTSIAERIERIERIDGKIGNWTGELIATMTGRWTEEKTVSSINVQSGMWINGAITVATAAKRIGLDMRGGARNIYRARLLSDPLPVQQSAMPLTLAIMLLLCEMP